MRLERAAAYLDISPSQFKRLVDEGTLPQPVRIGGVVSWDRLELDAAYDSVKDHGAQNIVHRLLREHQDAERLSQSKGRKG